MQRYINGEELTKAQYDALRSSVEIWRSRLFDIGWPMRCINETLARLANKEDQCTGRFWEGRFKSQALLDEKSLAACMAYVDLNPVRVGIEPVPEKSAHTSIRKRAAKARLTKQPNRINQQPTSLFPFAGSPRQTMPAGLPFELTDYLELVEWTGRQMREGKRGFIAQDRPSILSRLGIEPEQWQKLSTDFEGRTKLLTGSVSIIREKCSLFGKRWAHGLGNCKLLFG